MTVFAKSFSCTLPMVCKPFPCTDSLILVRRVQSPEEKEKKRDIRYVENKIKG